MRQLIRDAHAELLRALRDILGGDGQGLPMLAVTGLTAEPWASATFNGHRHAVEVRVRGQADEIVAAREAIAARLPGVEFDLRGHLMASIEMTGADMREEGGETVCELRFEALTVEE